VRATPQCEIRDRGVAAGRIRDEVMELEEARFRAPAQAADECALPAIALPDGSSRLRGNVP
jgi:hypothetical protein